MSFRSLPSHSEVHVWQASLDCEFAESQYFQQILSSDERHRAARFHFERDRRRYANGRGLLRVILGQYLNRMPAGIHFCYGAHGKPALLENDVLRFNLSNCENAMLLAIASSRELGVDIDRRHLDLDGRRAGPGQQSQGARPRQNDQFHGRVSLAWRIIQFPG